MNKSVLFAILGSVFCFRQLPSMAAEKVSLRYGLLEFSLPVSSLENYVATGEIDRHLDTYMQYADSQESNQLKQVLTYKIDLDRVTVYRFFNSYLGEKILQYLGEIIQTSPSQNGFYGLRSAIILAAGEPEGLNLLNVLRHFPTETMEINGETTLSLAFGFIELIEQTQKAIAAIRQQADLEAENTSEVDFTKQPDLQTSGSFAWKRETLALNDSQRDRNFTASWYHPELDVSTSTPVVVISPGLGADSDNFDYLARHLASYGFAVAIVNHPGSDRQSIENFWQGMSREIVEPQEFIDRPLDISYLLDELPKRHGSLNLEQVGIIGHSLGAYTALALAGAQLDLEYWQKYCESEFSGWQRLNLSILFQCLAAELTSKSDRLLDERIQAVFAINPMSSIFGREGLSQISIPLTFVAGSEDFVTPALLEQIEPFTWLKTPDKYLLLIEKGHHTYDEWGNTDRQESVTANNSSTYEISRGYFEALTVAFMQNYIATNNDYQLFVNSNYANFIGKDDLNLYLIQSLDTTDFTIFK